MLPTMPRAARELCEESNPETVAFTSTGQPALVAPVSTLREKIMCLGVPLTTSASKKSAREVRSTAGVFVMPTGLMLPQGRLLDGTAVPTFRDQIMAPVVASSA